MSNSPRPTEKKQNELVESIQVTPEKNEVRKARKSPVSCKAEAGFFTKHSNDRNDPPGAGASMGNSAITI